MPPLSISRAWDDTKAIIAREVHLLAALVLALVVLPQVVISIVGAPVGPQTTPLSQLVYIASVLLGFVAQIALTRLAIAPPIRLADAIVVGFSRVLPVFLVLVVLMFLLGIAAIFLAMLLSGAGVAVLPISGQAPPPALLGLLIVLMALAMAIFQLVFPIAGAETGNPIRLFVRSWQLGHRRYLRLLAFFITVLIALAVIGVFSQVGVGSVIMLLFGRPTPGSVAALFLGLISGSIEAAFTVVFAVMLARIYVQLATPAHAEAGVPSSGI